MNEWMENDYLTSLLHLARRFHQINLISISYRLWCLVACALKLVKNAKRAAFGSCQRSQRNIPKLADQIPSPNLSQMSTWVAIEHWSNMFCQPPPQVERREDLTACWWATIERWASVVRKRWVQQTCNYSMHKVRLRRPMEEWRSNWLEPSS